MSKIDVFRSDIAGSLEGWVAARQPMMVEMMDALHKTFGIKGDIAEIGVHHGLFLMLLAAVREEGETIRAFDVFEDQALNVDHSGNGCRAIFEGAIARWYDPEHFVIHQVDSMAMRGRAHFYLPKPVRLFSIDGGHTREHASNDLTLANDVMAPGGFVILDDFYAILWPGVTEGFFDFMGTFGCNLAPLVYFENKLYLTTRSEHRLFLEFLRMRLTGLHGAEMPGGPWKSIKLAGHSAIVVA